MARLQIGACAAAIFIFFSGCGDGQNVISDKVSPPPASVSLPIPAPPNSTDALPVSELQGLIDSTGSTLAVISVDHDVLVNRPLSISGKILSFDGVPQNGNLPKITFKNTESFDSIEASSAAVTFTNLILDLSTNKSFFSAATLPNTFFHLKNCVVLVGSNASFYTYADTIFIENTTILGLSSVARQKSLIGFSGSNLALSASIVIDATANFVTLVDSSAGQSAGLYFNVFSAYGKDSSALVMLRGSQSASLRGNSFQDTNPSGQRTKVAVSTQLTSSITDDGYPNSFNGSALVVDDGTAQTNTVTAPNPSFTSYNPISDVFADVVNEDFSLICPQNNPAISSGSVPAWNQWGSVYYAGGLAPNCP